MASLSVIYLIGLFMMTSCGAMNILIMAPGVTKSIVAFNGRFACTLAQGGHDVTMVTMIMSSGAAQTTAPCNIRQFGVNASSDPVFMDRHENLITNWTHDVHGNDLQFAGKFFAHVSDINVKTCKRTIDLMDNKGIFLGDKYDLAISTPFSYCATAVLAEQKMPFIWFIFGNYIPQLVADFQQIPYPPSYVPEMLVGRSGFMSFSQRLRNSIATLFMRIILEIPAPEVDVIRIRPRDPHFLPFRQLAHNVPLMTINGEMLLDFPRPLASSIYYIGSLKPKQNRTAKTQGLPEEWETWINSSSKGLIIFSFGTVVNTERLPDEMKQPFLSTFAKLRDYQIVWKTNAPIQPKGSVAPTDHIKMAKWIPQKQLLAYKGTKLLITHGGYNSLLESCEAGVPLLTIPLNLDQYGNAARAERLGIGLTVSKSSLRTDVLLAAISELLQNAAYQQRAQTMSGMLHDVPISRELQLLHMIGKAHRHYNKIVKLTQIRYIPQLQYFFLDVIGLAVGTVLVALLALWHTVRFFVRKFFHSL